MLGNPGNPYVVTLRAAIRRENSDTRPSQSDFVGSTLFNPYDAARCTTANCLIFGNLPTVTFGNLHTPQFLDQEYTEFNANANRLFASHDLKFGMNFLRTKVDGADPRLQQNQLFACTDDFERLGAATAGPYLLADAGGLTVSRRRDPSPQQLHGTLRAGRLAAWATS